MQGNLHVRFGEGDEETCPGNGIKRFIPTLRGPCRPRPGLPLSAQRLRGSDFCHLSKAAAARMVCVFLTYRSRALIAARTRRAE